MENLSNISVIRDVLSRHGFSFSKGLGQNFLINPTVCPRMAEMGNAKPGWGIIEIGAGVGVLTAELARRADKVVCIEIDSRLLPVLDETLAEFDNIKIVNEDVLKVDLHKLIEQEFAGMPVAVCANLPYYITSPHHHESAGSAPAHRLADGDGAEGGRRAPVRRAGQPGGGGGVHRGALLQRSEDSVPGFARVFSAPRRMWTPPSSVWMCATVRRWKWAVRSSFFKVVRAAFSQRRKTLPNTLSAGLGIPEGAGHRDAGEGGYPHKPARRTAHPRPIRPSFFLKKRKKAKKNSHASRCLDESLCKLVKKESRQRKNFTLRGAWTRVPTK